MTARGFLEFALDENFDLEEALFALGHYTGKGGSYFVSFPDADVLDQDGNPLEENTEEPAGFRGYWNDHLGVETSLKKLQKKMGDAMPPIKGD